MSLTIVGPTSLHVQTLNNRLIFLWGDYHRPSDTDWFNYIHQYTNQIDVCIETIGFGLDHSIDDSDYAMIRCWNHLRSYPKSNIRVHNIEFRRPYGTDTYDLLVFSEEDQYNQLSGKLDLYPRILAAMIDGDLSQVSSLFVELYQDFPSIQVDYIYETMIQHSHYHYLSALFESIPNREAVKSSLIRRVQDIDTVYDGIYDQIAGISSIFNDAYTIGRMIECIYKMEDSELIWVYVGHHHVCEIASILHSVYGSIPQLNISPSDTFQSEVILSSNDQKVLTSLVSEIGLNS